MQKVEYNKSEKPAEEIAFVYYILSVCSHAYAIRKRCVLNEKEWTGWLEWMKNCFKYGTISEQWNRIQSAGWFNLDFVNLVNIEIIDLPRKTF
jgi:hypothetical protein